MNLSGGKAPSVFEGQRSIRRDSRSESRRAVRLKQHQALLGPKMLHRLTPQLRPFLYHEFFISRAKISFLAGGACSTYHQPTPYLFSRDQGEIDEETEPPALACVDKNTDDDVYSCFVAVRCRSDMYLSTYKLCFAASKTHRRILSFLLGG